VHFTAMAKSANRFHIVSFSILAQRRFQWHLLNVLPVTYSISLTISFAAFLGWQNFNDRLQLLLLVMLTFTAYKTWMGDQLPKTQYATKIDKYLVACMFGMTLVSCFQNIVIWLVCMGLEEDGDDMSSYTSKCYVIDYIIGATFFVVWTALHIWIYAFSAKRHNLKDVPHMATDCPSFASCRFHETWKETMGTQIKGGSLLRPGRILKGSQAKADQYAAELVATAKSPQA